MAAACEVIDPVGCFVDGTLLHEDDTEYKLPLSPSLSKLEEYTISDLCPGSRLAFAT